MGRLFGCYIRILVGWVVFSDLVRREGKGKGRGGEEKGEGRGGYVRKQRNAI